VDNGLLDRLQEGNQDSHRRNPDQGRHRIVARSGVGDFERADVLIEGKKIVAVGPTSVRTPEVIDASGMIVMPGYSSPHIITSTRRCSAQSFPMAFLAILLEAIGRRKLWCRSSSKSDDRPGFPGATAAAPPVWDLGRVPYDPEDNYISES